MEKPNHPGDGNDSADLQALFDSIAAGAPPAPPPPQADPAGDSDDLQALFDSVAGTRPAGAATPGAAKGADGGPQQEVVFNRLGQLARQLHDSLRGLGVDKILADTAQQVIPDARQRLAYIAQMTEQAASRVLNAADIAKPIQDELMTRSEAMARRWDKMFANQLSVDEFKLLAADTRTYFADAPPKLKITNDQLMEIMMAQDFQDLTGQVIKKMVEVVQQMETQLLSLLIEAMPDERKAETPDSLLNGPVINSAGRSDVVTSQVQVDDLLESLGF